MMQIEYRRKKSGNDTYSKQSVIYYLIVGFGSHQILVSDYVGVGSEAFGLDWC